MISVNAPFIIALAIIIFLIAARWLEWYLFKYEETQKKEEGRLGATASIPKAKEIKKGRRRIGAAGTKLKALLFYGEDDLNRPWYVGLPFALFIAVQNFLVDLKRMELYQVILFCSVGLTLSVCLNVAMMLFANKSLLQEKEKRRRYIRSQISQIILICVLLSFVIAGMQVRFEKIYADPPWLKESVEWVIEPSYKADWPHFSEGLAAVGETGKKEFIDRNGEVVIPMQYDDVSDFSEGLAAVRKGKKWGYIDRGGTQVIPNRYDIAFEFEGGLAPVKENGIWKAINEQGQEMFVTSFKYFYPYHEGVAVVELRDENSINNTSDNLIDTQGRLLFGKKYRFSGDFNEGCIPVYDFETNSSYYLDRNEQRVIPYEYLEAGRFRDGCAPVWIKEDEYALIDHFGNVVRRLSEREYSLYPLYNEGLTTIHRGEWGGSGKNLYRAGFQDMYGNVLIPTEFQRTAWPSEGFIGLQVDGLWGFIENPLPEAARGVDPELWAADRTLIATVEGQPVYAGELESTAYAIRAKDSGTTGITAYKKAFEQIKFEKAFVTNGNDFDTDGIQYQIGSVYYRLLLLESK